MRYSPPCGRRRQHGLLIGIAIAAALTPRAIEAGDVSVGGIYGADSGKYRGGGTGGGLGLEAGYTSDQGLGGFVTLAIASSTRGDSDPILWASLDARYRMRPRMGADEGPLYLAVGAGVGLAGYPLAHIDGAILPLLAEVGCEVPLSDRLGLAFAIQERPIIVLTGGDPFASFLNRVGFLVSLRHQTGESG